MLPIWAITWADIQSIAWGEYAPVTDAKGRPVVNEAGETQYRVKRGVRQTGQPYLIAAERRISPHRMRSWLGRGRAEQEAYERAVEEEAPDAVRTRYAEIYTEIQAAFAAWVLDMLGWLEDLGKGGDSRAIAYLLDNLTRMSVADVPGAEAAAPSTTQGSRVMIKLRTVMKRHGPPPSQRAPSTEALVRSGTVARHLPEETP